MPSPALTDSSGPSSACIVQIAAAMRARIMFGFQIDQAHETLLVQCSACAFGLCSGAGANLSVLLQAYGMHFADANGRPYMSSGGRIPKGAPVLVGSTEEIEELRPKSPPPGGDRNQS